MKIKVKVIPQASKDEVLKIKDADGSDMLKIKTTKPPEDGKANEAVIEILAEYFGVKKSAVNILSGEVSRVKIIEIL